MSLTNGSSLPPVFLLNLLPSLGLCFHWDLFYVLLALFLHASSRSSTGAITRSQNLTTCSVTTRSNTQNILTPALDYHQLHVGMTEAIAVMCKNNLI